MPKWGIAWGYRARETHAKAYTINDIRLASNPTPYRGQKSNHSTLRSSIS